MVGEKKSLPPLLVILGPTGSGKSDLAVRLARRFNGELVSADSRQLYKGMDIATAKLKPLKVIKQWMVDVVSPNRRYTLRQYQRGALSVIHNIHKRGKLPILVGGTGLYIDSVVENWIIPPVSERGAIRKQLELDLRKDGLSVLVNQLRRVDPSSARHIDIYNPRRVVRALEVSLATGESFLATKRKGSPLFKLLKIGIIVPRNELRRRLEKRTESMVRQGLISETKRLLKKYSPNMSSMSGIGYKEAAMMINGEISKETMIDLIVTHSMQYARRQMTWWKRDKSIVWIKRPLEASQLVSRWAVF